MNKKGVPVATFADLMTVADWREAVEAGMFNKHDGSGSFVKDGKYLTGEWYDNVFGPIPPEATHIAWFNK